MVTRTLQRLEEWHSRDVMRWYATAADGDTAVLERPVPPAVWLIRRPHAQVYWWTEGGPGLTLSLADACARLAMVQGRRPSNRTGHALPGADDSADLGGNGDGTPPASRHRP